MSDSNKNTQKGWLSIGEAAKYLRISKDTLRRWEKRRILKAHRSPTNRRFYKKQDLERIFSKVVPQAKGNLLSLAIIGLFTTFIIITAFLAWLLLSA